MLEKNEFVSNGITLQPIRLMKKLSTGDNKKMSLFDVLGTRASFSINLKPSAKGCIKPNTPIVSGPFRF